MKSIDKLKVINEKIDLLNNSILKNKKWNFKFANKGVNNYCITIVLKGEELFSAKFDTYGSLLSALNVIEYMFKKELEERQRKEGY